MGIIMEERLSLLKCNFNEIVDLKQSNILILNTLDTRIKKIKEIYGEFISSHRDNLFVFTLDSFHFQGKLIDLEYEDMNRMFLTITNRMYCDYYKLFKIMVEYVKENIPDRKLTELIKVHDNYPVYKDLEPFKQYDFQYIQSLHEVILSILSSLHLYIMNKEHDLKIYQTKNKIGLNIDSFVNTFSFNNVVMNQKTMLFINYMEFFHKMQTKYLKRFTMKLNLMLSQINHDIKLDDPNNTKVVKNEVITDLKENNIDKKLLQELKVSMYDDASIISSSDNTKTYNGFSGSRSASNSGSRSASNSGSRPSSETGSNNSEESFNDNTPIEMVSELVSELTDDDMRNTSKPIPRYRPYTPLKNYNGTPEGVQLDIQGQPLPINESPSNLLVSDLNIEPQMNADSNYHPYKTKNIETKLDILTIPEEYENTSESVSVTIPNWSELMDVNNQTEDTVDYNNQEPITVEIEECEERSNEIPLENTEQSNNKKRNKKK